MRLVDSTSATEVLSVGPFTSTILNRLDFGYPKSRAVSVSAAGANGEIDTTRYMGARVLTAEVTLPQGLGADDAYDQLASVCNPGLRLWMYTQRPGWDSERRIYVRGDTFDCPPGVSRQGQMTFISPTGLFEDPNWQVTTVTPLTVASSGRSYPRHYPWSYRQGPVAGAGIANVGGTVPALPIISIYGPCSNPLVRCVDTGQQVSFPGLTIGYGDFLQIDMGSRTVYMNGDSTQNYYSRRDLTTSTWWSLPARPGVNVLFSATATDAGCQAVLAWHPTYL